MKFILGYIKHFKRRMLCGLSVKIVATFMELLLPVILRHILNTVILSESVYKIIFWGVLMVICAVLACVLNVAANRSAAKVSALLSERIRGDLFKKSLNLSARQTDKFTIPSLESRITTDTYNVHSFINTMQRMGVRAPIILVGGIIITLIIDAYLSLVMLATIPLIFFIVLMIRKKGVPLYTKVHK